MRYECTLQYIVGIAIWTYSEWHAIQHNIMALLKCGCCCCCCWAQCIIYKTNVQAYHSAKCHSHIHTFTRTYCLRFCVSCVCLSSPRHNKQFMYSQFGVECGWHEMIRSKAQIVVNAEQQRETAVILLDTCAPTITHKDRHSLIRSHRFAAAHHGKVMHAMLLH